MGNTGQVGLTTEPAATLSVEDPGPPRVREPMLKRRESGGQASTPDRAQQQPGQFCKPRDAEESP